MKYTDADLEHLYKCAKNTDALLKAEALSKDAYEPPITLYMNEIQTTVEDNCLKVVQSYGFNVDKDELKKALDYDRYGDYNCMYQTYGFGYVCDGKWSPFINGETGWQDARIIAWMPLPEPYKEAENE